MEDSIFNGLDLLGFTAGDLKDTKHCASVTVIIMQRTPSTIRLTFLQSKQGLKCPEFCFIDCQGCARVICSQAER
jgi:hypothetical protein